MNYGESEVIVAAKEFQSDYLLIDDKASRYLAEALMLELSDLI